MSAPQPPKNGDEPVTGADATNGSAPTPVETPQTPTEPANAKAASRNAAPRKPAAGTSAPRKTTAGARAPRQSTGTADAKTVTESADSPEAAAASETAATQVLPASQATEELVTAPADQEPQSMAAPAGEPELPAAAETVTSATVPPAVEAATPEATAPVTPAPEQPASQPPSTSEPPAAHQAAPPARTITEVFADRLDNDGFFSALFDFTFMRYVTRKLAGPVYVVGLVLIGLSTILALIYWLGQAIATQSFLGAFVFLFGLIITVVGSALAILLLRVTIEVFVAVVAIAENTRPHRKQGP